MNTKTKVVSTLLGAALLGGVNAPVIPSVAYAHQAYVEEMDQHFHDQLADDAWMENSPVKISKEERARLLALPLGVKTYKEDFIGDSGITTLTLKDRNAYDNVDLKATTTQKVSVIDMFTTTPEAQAAIAFGTQAQGQGSAVTSLSVAMTIPATANAVFVGCPALFGGVSDDITTVSYNGVNSTQIQKKADPGSVTDFLYQYYLLIAAPDGASHNIVYSRVSSGFIVAQAESFSGVSQSGQPDATGSASGTATSSITTTVTTVSDNDWISLCGGYDNGSVAASTNSTQRGTTLTTFPIAIFDNNSAITPPQKFQMKQTSGSGNDFTVAAAFAPVQVPSPLGATQIILNGGAVLNGNQIWQ